MTLKPIYSLNHLLQASYDPPRHQVDWNKIQLIPFSFFSSDYFRPQKLFPCLSTGRLDNFRLMDLWQMDKRKNYSSYKPHFRKSIRSNFIQSKIHRNRNIFSGGTQKIIILKALSFIGLFFSEINNLCNIRTRVHKAYFSEFTYSLYYQFYLFCIID